MDLKLKPINQQVIVITGASSGIGLATALEAAKRGARLVLSSRSDDTLQQVVEQINSSGGDAAFVHADVANRDEMKRVA